MRCFRLFFIVLLCVFTLLPGVRLNPAAARELHPIVYDSFLLGGLP